MTIRAMALASLCAAALGAQARPSTDVWVVPMRRGGSVPAFGAPVNATHRTGYDNQPSFTPKGDGLLYTVIGADGAADIWRVALPPARPRPMTATKESEYSATVTPDGRWLRICSADLIHGYPGPGPEGVVWMSSAAVSTLHTLTRFSMAGPAPTGSWPRITAPWTSSP